MTKRLSDMYTRLLDRYGDPCWWPAGSVYEVMTGAVLTQNTAWTNVEKAIAHFGDGLFPHVVASIDEESLRDIIRPAGSFNRKALCLKALTAWYACYGYDEEQVRRHPMDKLRRELLALKGIGPETADSILLYAFGFPSFVADAYTMRLCARYPLDAGEDYHGVKSFFESHIANDALLYNRFHALIVINAKAHCRKKPLCAGCPLYDTCERRGL